MRTTVTAACLLGVAALSVGCAKFNNGGPALEDHAAAPDPPPQAAYLSAASVEVADEQGGGTAVENALVWSEKYADAVEKLVLMQQENRFLSEDNSKQAEQVAKLQAELRQCQKELGEANAMLIDMRTELKNWKADVLGFRQEMREAQQAQLIALRSVLKLLGGEVIAAAPDSQADSSGSEGSNP